MQVYSVGLKTSSRLITKKNQKSELIAINPTVKEKHLAQCEISFIVGLKSLTSWSSMEDRKEKKLKTKEKKNPLSPWKKKKFSFVVQELGFHHSNFLASAKWDVLGLPMQSGIKPSSHLLFTYLLQLAFCSFYQSFYRQVFFLPELYIMWLTA